MPGMIFGIPFDEELFLDMWNEAPDPYYTAMIQSGAVVEDSTIAGMIQNHGNIYTIPFYNTLEGEDLNYDGQTDITVEEVGGGSQTGVVYGRAKGFFARNFTAELSGGDPMGHIVSSVEAASNAVNRYFRRDLWHHRSKWLCQKVGGQPYTGFNIDHSRGKENKRDRPERSSNRVVRRS